MASLYKSVQNTRRIAIGILIFFVLVMVWNVLQSFQRSQNNLVDNETSRAYMTANRIFGEIEFPEIPSIQYNQDATFRIESAHQTFPDVSYVYKIEEPRQKLLSFENALRTVGVLGFNNQEQNEVETNLFRWLKDNNSKILEYEQRLQKWQMDTLYLENEAAIQRKVLNPDLNRYINQTGSLLSRLGFDSGLGLNNGIVEARYTRIGLDGVFVDVTSVDSAEYVLLNVYRNLSQADLKDATDLPRNIDRNQLPEATSGKVYNDDPRFGQVKLMVSNSVTDLQNDIFEIDYTDFEYNPNAGAYILVTPEEAWDLVQTGKGYLTLMQAQGSNFFNKPDSVDVRTFVADARLTELAFYEPNEWKGYAYPIYVFTGRADLKDGRQARFVFYVDAIKRL